ncbi:MAG: lamin tail domain-containing protein [Kiritimatiellae bacterium]|nr:lamin tail domain-containing protein [Kiritimatiellia bacterium]
MKRFLASAVSAVICAAANAERVTLDTSTMTAECRVRFAAGDNPGQANILETGVCPYLGGCFRIYYDSGRIHAEFSYPGNWDGEKVSAAYNANGRWHHIALVLDPDQDTATAGALYIDGYAVAALPWDVSKTVFMGSQELYVGTRAQSANPSAPFAGEIESVRVLAQALDPSQFLADETDAPVATGDLRICEVCPRPDGTDPNGKVSGWIELVNRGESDVDLADYEIVRKNRGKEAKAGKAKLNLKPRTVRPGERVLVYTSEEYDNCEDLGGDGTVKVYGDGVMVYPAKVNPKKFPYLQLYRGTDSKTLVDELVVPVDIKDGWSVVPLEYADRNVRLLVPNPTPGEAENLAGAVDYGPNVSPLYGVKHSLSDLDPYPLAVPGEDYEVSFAINPVVMKTAKEGDAIVAVDLVYSCDWGAAKRVAMAASAEADKSAGTIWKGTIPAADLPARGRLVRFAANIRTADGAQWRSPSFCNPDDGYEWYGTIVEPGALASSLQTFHLFAAGESLAQMDVDADAQDLSKVPYNARVNVFDSQTGKYYDNVRIDLRGNTSALFWKKSHGLRFAKCNPLVCVNQFTGEEIEVRKTSFVAEFTDPTNLRQSLALTFFHNRSGAYAPFGYPVRLNLNGEFWQVATHSNRFTDEMIEDWYGFDPLGWGYKNVGRITPDLSGGVVIEKKTPDDGDETSAAAYAPLRAFAQDIVDANFGPGVVVREMDLPAWINYLASARITHETDDVWSNISIYGDLEGTGTWIPLGYDMNQSWGHVYWSAYGGARDGAHADRDSHKSHPLYGGTTVVSHDYYGNAAAGNNAIETIYRHPKFRNMYLRRLRTLMDEYLKEPGTPKEETPVWQDVVAFTNAAQSDIALDFAKWRNNPDGDQYSDWTKTYIYCWDRPLTQAEGLDDLWENYIVPRRIHLYETHSVTNAMKAIGYGTEFNAGIPLAQSPVGVLRRSISIESVDGSAGAATIRNGNGEAVDMSGWRLSGAVEWRLPPGTVVDAGDTLTVVADRKAYVAARADSLSDEVIVGNAPFAGGDALSLRAADGAFVCANLPVDLVTRVGTEYSSVAFILDVTALAGINGVEAGEIEFVVETPDGTFSAPAGADGKAAVRVRADPGSFLEYTVGARRTGGGELDFTIGESGQTYVADVAEWFDSVNAGDGAWSVGVLEDGEGNMLHVYTPARRQPADDVVVDARFTVFGRQRLADLPDAGEMIAGFTAADGSWYAKGADGWIALENADVEPEPGESYALKIRYNRAAGKIGFAIATGDGLKTLTDANGSATIDTADGGDIADIALLGDWGDEERVAGFGLRYAAKSSFSVRVR